MLWLVIIVKWQKFVMINNNKAFLLNTLLEPPKPHGFGASNPLWTGSCKDQWSQCAVVYVVYLTCAYAWWSFWFWVSYCSEEYRAFLYTTLLLKSVSRTEVKCQEWKTNSSTKMFWWFPLKSDIVQRKVFFRWSWSLQVPFLLFLWTWHTWYIYM